MCEMMHVKKKCTTVTCEETRHPDGRVTSLQKKFTSERNISLKRKPESADQEASKKVRISWGHDFMLAHTSRFCKGNGLIPPTLDQLKSYKAEMKCPEYNKISHEYSTTLVQKSLSLVLPYLWPSLATDEKGDSEERQGVLQRIVEANGVMTSFVSVPSTQIISLLDHRKEKLTSSILKTHIPRVFHFWGRDVKGETSTQVYKNGSIGSGPNEIKLVRRDDPSEHKEYKALSDGIGGENKITHKSVVPSMTAMVFKALTSLTKALRIINTCSWDLLTKNTQSQKSARKSLMIYLEQVRRVDV